jgi:hypothetical protein
MGKARTEVAADWIPRFIHWQISSAGIVLLMLSGCANMSRTPAATPTDPLLGTPPGTQVKPLVPGATPTASLPPLPPSTDPGAGTASLAGLQRSGNLGSDLRIPNASASSDGWNTSGANLQPAATGAVLQVPQANLAAPAPPAPIASTAPSATPGQLTSYEQAQELLQARGVVWQRLEAVGDTGEWKFSCAIPNRQNPRLRRVYEARAKDSMSAVRSAIDQMDKDR